MNALPRIGIFGAGVMGGYHARVVAQSPACELARIIDPDVQAVTRLAERYGVEAVANDDELAGLDAVIVASPTEHHENPALLALSLGLPVLVEKPVSADLETTRKIVNEAANRDLPLMCGFVERFNPAIRTVLPHLENPIHVTAARHSPYPDRIRTGVAWDLLIHDVDTCLQIVQQGPTQVAGGLGYFHPSSVAGSEDIAEAVLTFGSGMVASISASRVGQRKLRSLTIAELGKTVEIDLLRRDVTIYRHVSHESMQTDGGYRHQTIIEIPELVTAQEPLAAQLEHFVNLVVGRADAKRERDSIIPPHAVIAQLPSSAISG